LILGKEGLKPRESDRIWNLSVMFAVTEWKSLTVIITQLLANVPILFVTG